MLVAFTRVYFIDLRRIKKVRKMKTKLFFGSRFQTFLRNRIKKSRSPRCTVVYLQTVAGLHSVEGEIQQTFIPK